MAADPEPDWLSCLPPSWTCGVTRDGRIFFINEEAQSTIWVHPVSGDAVSTGHRRTADLPMGWEEGYTFEGARCFINHNEQKVTCKHPVSSIPSQDNCIFVVNEQPAPQVPSARRNSCDKKERPTSTMSEVSSSTGGAEYSTFPGSPAPPLTTAPTSTSSTRLSRSSKKIHNFGKRSNSIKRSVGAAVVKSSWLYKQDSTGMKLWKKRWFVLSDMCLYYYRDDKEESILGSILLPSFHISMLSVDDHIGRKYAFKATHPNMRTYVFCTDTEKEMESWMKVMTDAALVHTEVRRLDELKVEQQLAQEMNHRVLNQPEIRKNEHNRELVRQHSSSRAEDKLHKDLGRTGYHGYYTLQRDGERYGTTCMVQKDEERFLIHKDVEKHEKSLQHKDGEICAIQDLETYAVQKVDEKYMVTPTEDKHAPARLGERFMLNRDGEKYALQNVGDRNTLQKDGHMYISHKEVKRQLSLKETERHCAMRDTDNKCTRQIMDKYGILKEVNKGQKSTAHTAVQKYATIHGGSRPRFQADPSAGRAWNETSSRIQPAAGSESHYGQANLIVQKPVQVNGPASVLGTRTGDGSPAEVEGCGKCSAPIQEPERGLSRTSSMQQQEHWVHAPRTSGPDARSAASYQTLPRKMPSHWAHIVPRYPEGYRTLPKKTMMRPGSIYSVAGSVYDQTLQPTSASSAVEKRRSIRDGTMWQLYEWQQRQSCSRQSVAPPAAVGQYCTLPSTKTMGNISEHSVAHSIPPSPSHGPLAPYGTFSFPQQPNSPNPNSTDSEAVAPLLKGDGTLEHRQKAHLTKYGYRTDRRSMPPVPSQTITPQSLQGKTPEELTLLLIKLRREQAALDNLREHTVVQLMALDMEAHNAKTDVLSHHLQRHLICLDGQRKETEPLIAMIHAMIENSAPRPQLYQQISPDDNKDASLIQSTGETDVDTKLSRLCEQDKAVRIQEEKLQQLHSEKRTLEAALLSASQELREQSSSNTASLLQQRDVLHRGLLSTCRALSRVGTELERSWREYDRLGADVTLAKSNLLEQLEALGSPQTEPPSQQHIQIQKELWRIQDVVEALSKTRPQRSTQSSCLGSMPRSGLQTSKAVTPLPLSPLKEGKRVPPCPPLPEYHDSFERLPQVPRPSRLGGRLPPYVPRQELRKASGRNGVRSQAPDNRLYKSEPELTSVKEEVDEAGGGEKDKNERKDATEAEVDIVPPSPECPMKTPESSTIASYVTLRKTKKTESRSDRPRSALDQIGLGDREVGRMRMSVEEQLERMRRNQQSLSRREKKRETLPRPSSLNQETPLVILQVGQGQEELNEAVQRDKDMALQNVETSSLDNQLCVGQRAAILQLHPTPPTQHAPFVQLPPVQDEESRAQDLNSSPPDPEDGFQTPATPSPVPREEEPGVTIQSSGVEQLETHRQEDRKHNNNMFASEAFTLVNSDT
ncbi:pleckstrin homology domain-containing family A member 5-like [Brachionichthys hirsutus]|uniref:pleckstrin homology domain-containing family A member 5-like n=1 Tax=Brachionichthys hirsutus TaxID=412623 RepID=UPI0036043BE8